MTFASVYEMFRPMSETWKHRFWEDWQSDDLPTNWTFKDNTGTGSVSMVDSGNADDAMVRIVSGANTNDWSQISASDSSGTQDQLDTITGAIMDCTMRRNSVNGINYSGMNSASSIGTNYIRIRGASSATFYGLQTKITSTTTVDTSVADDNNFHRFKLYNSSDNSLGMMWMDNLLEAISTTNIHNGRSHVTLSSLAQASSACQVDCTWCEAYSI